MFVTSKNLKVSNKNYSSLKKKKKEQLKWPVAGSKTPLTYIPSPKSLLLLLFVGYSTWSSPDEKR